jgi:hypothetical protein
MYLEALERVAVGRDLERVRMRSSCERPIYRAGGCWKLGEEMEKRRRPESHP